MVQQMVQASRSIWLSRSGHDLAALQSGEGCKPRSLLAIWRGKRVNARRHRGHRLINPQSSPAERAASLARAGPPAVAAPAPTRTAPSSKRILTALDQAAHPRAVEAPGLRPTEGERRGGWSARVRANPRILFRFGDGCGCDVDLDDCTASCNTGGTPVYDPAHPGELLDEFHLLGRLPAEAALQLGIDPDQPARVEERRRSVSPGITLQLEAAD